MAGLVDDGFNKGRHGLLVEHIHARGLYRLVFLS
jgi:hypothetical protein